jgi:L-fuconolactonase
MKICEHRFRRRQFLKNIGAGAATGLLLEASGPGVFESLAAEDTGAKFCPAIDTHIHLYDPTRAQGVPWPPKNDAILYAPHLPEQFKRATKNLNIVGAVVVEASPWLTDNQWVLDIAKEEPLVVGFIGHLEMGQAEFANQMKRFARNPIFRGLRLQDSALAAGLGQAGFEMDLERFADQGFTLDVVGPAAMLPNVKRMAERLPNLKVVIDHLPFREWNGQNPEVMRDALKEVAELPNVYVKISDVPRQRDGKLIEDMEFYRPGLDVLWNLFGPDRAVYGSNWPVSDLVAPYPVMHQIVVDYFKGKSAAEAEKFFWRNSLAAYRWRPRGAAVGLVK